MGVCGIAKDAGRRLPAVPGSIPPRPPSPSEAPSVVFERSGNKHNSPPVGNEWLFRGVLSRNVNLIYNSDVQLSDCLLRIIINKKKKLSFLQKISCFWSDVKDVRNSLEESENTVE